MFRDYLPYRSFGFIVDFPRISGFFDDSKSQISDLADRAAKDIVDFYDELAMKSVNDAILKVNDLLIAFRVVEKSFNKPNPKGM